MTSVARSLMRFGAATALLPAIGISAQTIRGTVYDSLTMSRLARASVWVQGGTASTVADSNGTFSMDNVPAGDHFVAFSSPALDSLGLGVLGARVKVEANRAAQIELTTPSFATVSRALCRGFKFAADSGITWGVVRDAENDQRLSNARTAIEWSVPKVAGNKQVVTETGSQDVRTDSTGSYYACGVPLETSISAAAMGSFSTSGVVQYRIGARRIARLDLKVSREALRVSSDTSSASATRGLSGTPSVSGVISGENQQVLAKATVSFTGVDTVAVADSTGRFTFSGLPAGTHMIEVRQVGYTPVTMLVDLAPGQVTPLSVTMNNVSQLETVSVKAKGELTRDRDEFEARRRAGFGHALSEDQIKDKADLLTAIRQLPNLQVYRMRGQLEILPPDDRSLKAKNCKVRFWLDGRPTTVEILSVLNVSEIKGIEWYPTASRTPPQLTADCATMVVWSDRARWGN
jgi:hypothetical protein